MCHRIFTNLSESRTTMCQVRHTAATAGHRLMSAYNYIFK